MLRGDWSPRCPEQSMSCSPRAQHGSSLTLQGIAAVEEILANLVCAETCAQVCPSWCCRRSPASPHASLGTGTGSASLSPPIGFLCEVSYW